GDHPRHRAARRDLYGFAAGSGDAGGDGFGAAGLERRAVPQEAGMMNCGLRIIELQILLLIGECRWWIHTADSSRQIRNPQSAIKMAGAARPLPSQRPVSNGGGFTPSDNA